MRHTVPVLSCCELAHGWDPSLGLRWCCGECELCGAVITSEEAGTCPPERGKAGRPGSGRRHRQDFKENASKKRQCDSEGEKETLGGENG